MAGCLEATSHDYSRADMSAFQPIAFCNTGGDTALGMSLDGVPPLTSRHGDPGNGVTFAVRGREGGAQAEVSEMSPALRTPGGGSSHALVAQATAVRRLTPRECERLQGFPDDYTAIPGAKDGPRYKALGNSMAVPVMRWIGERIQMVEDAIKEAERAA